MLSLPVLWYLLVFSAIVRQDGYLNDRIDPLFLGGLFALLITPVVLALTTTKPTLRKWLAAGLAVALLSFAAWVWTIPVIS